ncbi:hypothetical protein [Cohnella lupini]|uniref:hypothetical protein n=1 Tax=Cohnella lupini TaxID=1294267 RepID=UPI0015F28615|nr:hypothetical protein [Cohnella lupini]
MPILPTTTVSAAFNGSNSSENPPQSIAGKTDIASWSYGSTGEVTAAAGTVAATSGYYKKAPDTTNSTLQLFKITLW